MSMLLPSLILAQPSPSMALLPQRSLFPACLHRKTTPRLSTITVTASITEDNSSLYKIDKWGPPYFGVNSSGNISVKPYGTDTVDDQEIDLLKIVKEVSDPNPSASGGLQLPLIVRFPDVLKNRLVSLQAAFDSATETSGYGSYYQGVFPVKSNQDRYIVEDIVEFGKSFNFGLEGGSKPELLMAMNCLISKGSPEAFMICNGFKDAEYIWLALVARKLGVNSYIVLEQEEELDLVIEISQKLNVRPVIGVRAKLKTKHPGHYGPTSGENSKFGLKTAQIVSIAEKLQEVGMLDCLQLLHFHMGSMIPTTDVLTEAVTEASQIYCELVSLGANMKIFDVGGGLGIDYDGSKSGDSDDSVAYTIEEYASAVVSALQNVCDSKSVKHPVICSESGRAIVSHHSILIFEAIGTTTGTLTSEVSTDSFVQGLTEEGQAKYSKLIDARNRGDKYETCLLYADQLKQHCLKQFINGSLSIKHLAVVDSLCELVLKDSRASDDEEEQLRYNVNLSIFTSIPDFWGIGQLFPIVPIHRLNQTPEVNGILLDLTCDSDGKIDKFIGGDPTLPLHTIENDNGFFGGGDQYYLGMFLGGAYEEAIGGLHNLFGRTTVVRVFSQSSENEDDTNNYKVTLAVPGPSCAFVLREMQHEPELMLETLKQRAEDYLDDPADIESGLERTFNNMPYLVPSPNTSSHYLAAAKSKIVDGDHINVVADSAATGDHGKH